MNVLHDHEEFDNGTTPEMLEFYRNHCATSSKHLIMVTAVFPPYESEDGEDGDSDEESAQISRPFSSFEAADNWVNALHPDVAVIFDIVVVDNPLFGSEAVN
jgi:hypothetical protein